MASHLEQLELLHEATLAFTGTLDLSQVLRQIMDKTQRLLHALGWAVWLVDPLTGELVCEDAAGPDSGSAPGTRLAPGQGIVGAVVEKGQSIYVSDLANHPMRLRDRHSDFSTPVRSLLCSALIAEQGTIGALVVADASVDAYGENEQALLDALAASASTAIENARLYEQAKRELEERRRSELALRQSEAYYRTLVETSPDAIIVTDLEGRVTLCNHQALRLHRLDHRSELLGRNILTLFAPGSISEARSQYDQVIRGAAVSRMETELLRRGGTTFAAEWTASLIAGSRGESRGVVSFTRDISATKRTTEALERHNEDLRILNAVAVELSRSGDPPQLLGRALDRTLKAIGAETGWISLSSWDRMQPRPTDAIEIRQGMLADPDHQAQARTSAMIAHLNTAVEASHTLETARSPWLSATGRIWCATWDVTAIPIIALGSVVGILGTVTRPTEDAPTLSNHDRELLSALGRQIGVAVESACLRREIAETELLRELNQLRSELIANFSHDLRTPLGIIEMAASTLRRDDGELSLSADMRDEFLLDIEEQVAHLSLLIQDILDIGRLESGKLTLERTALDLSQVIRGVVNSMRRANGQHTFTVDLPPPPLVALADRGRIEQVLYNLLDNAIKYTPGGGAVMIRGEEIDGQIRISIEDPGIGIPSDQLGLIFARFYRVENESTREIKGAGLGLATAKGIIEAHGGIMWAESDLGQGSVFRFTLPSAASVSGNNST